MNGSPCPAVPRAAAAPGAELDLLQQTRMVGRLRSLLAEKLGGEVVQIETHISFVLLGGGQAYKFKKALRTPFLDQTTRALRQRACEEELRLNRRLAPTLYQAVVPITGSADAPGLGGGATAIDYAVQMRAFAQDGLWDALAARGALQAGHIDELVRVLAAFHAGAAVAGPHGRLGTPAQVRAPVRDNLGELEAMTGTEPGLRGLRAWEEAAFGRIEPVLARRLAQGWVRECHGDLHLGNVTQHEGHATVFDGIEFSDDLRWIDVMSEIAFMAMDLHAHGLPELAHRFVNGCLEHSGDYEGLRVLDYYVVHRALVRAKVALLRAAQCAGGQSGRAAQERARAGRYFEQAQRAADRARARPFLLLTHGLSGSGKTTFAQRLLEACGAVRIRADVERKRLAGLPPLARSDAGAAAGLYGDAMTAATYAQLGRLAVPVLESGRHTILDATFLMRAQRDEARRLAARQGVACLILDFAADAELLRRRLRERAARGDDASDADEAVLALQLRTAQPLQADESALVWRCPVPGAGAGAESRPDWARLLQQLASGGAPAP